MKEGPRSPRVLKNIGSNWALNVVQILVFMVLTTYVPFRAAKVAHLVSQVAAKDGAQPGRKLVVISTAKLIQRGMSLQDRFLHHIGGIKFGS